MTSGVALNCGSFCTCTGLTNNTCLFGPDDKGHFFTDNAVSSETVEACSEVEFGCLCDTHAEVVAQIEADASLTFDWIAM